MSDTIFELQVGYHANKNIPYQRIICDTDFTNPYFELNDNGNVKYGKTLSSHWIPEVEKICKNTDVILEVAKINYEAGKMIATIGTDGNIHFDEDMDIWKDIKVWNKGEYPKYQPERLGYVKESYHSRYLKSGINEIKMKTDPLYHKGHILHFIIESTNRQNRYTVNIMGSNRLERELTNCIHGDYHGYRYFKSFEEVQEWFESEYGVRLFKKGRTEYCRY